MKSLKLMALLLLFAGTAGAQTMTLVQTNSATVSAQTQNVTISTSSVAAGDVIVVFTNWGGVVGDSTTVSDNNSNTYTEFNDGSHTCFSTQGNILRGFKAVNGTTQASVTVTTAFGGGVNHTIRTLVMEYSSSTGWPSNPLDVCNSNSSSTGVQLGDTGSVTPASSPELGLGAIQWGTVVSSITVTSPYIRQDGAGTGWGSTARVDSCDNTATSSGAQTCAFAWVTSTSYGAIIGVLKPNTAGAGGAKQLSLTGVGAFLWRHLFWSPR